ncbi:MAG TPA: heat-inducible transcriptional repressor HrcA [Gemmatimonadaceae bacterium]|nr:heat-inducible transcriptional repressor HrcA [Gemmatimonadaceae bacterium]
MPSPELSERERKVLEAVIRTYVQTAEPAGSRTLSRAFGLGVSPATIRNTMSDLEEKGFLFHPHTSAGRVPTDKAYRAYVDFLMQLPVSPVEAKEREQLEAQIRQGGAIEAIVSRAAQSLGVVAQELGVALGPSLDEAILQRLELIRVSAERLLMVLTLKAGIVRTVFVEVRGEIADEALAHVAIVLNERLAGLSLQEIRASVAARLRDAGGDGGGTRELLNVFVQESEQLFDAPVTAREAGVLLGQASLLAEQPEFANAPQMRRLIELTETPERLAEVLRRRHATQGISVTIGGEHADPRLDRFTVVTAQYRAGSLGGVIGVIGPTRMPYDKVVSLVRHTSQLLTDLLD